jgi:hypothetical protein
VPRLFVALGPAARTGSATSATSAVTVKVQMDRFMIDLLTGMS